MDKLARVWAGWFVTGIVGGIGLTAAGFLAPSDMPLPRVALVLAGGSPF
jgi:hypothetical protein